MSANVITLASRRPAPRRAATCRACRPGFTCHPHRLVDLAHRLHAAEGRDAEALLIPRQTLDDVLEDVLAVLDGITGELTLTDERGTR